ISMKINYKNFALGLIDDPDNFNFGIDGGGGMTPHKSPKELKDFGNSLIENSPLLKQMCGGNIQFISRSFADAFSKGFHKLKSLFYIEEINDSGVLLVGGSENGYTHTHTYYYVINTIKDKDDKILSYDLLFMDFSKHADAKLHGLDIYITVQTDR